MTTWPTMTLSGAFPGYLKSRSCASSTNFSVVIPRATNRRNWSRTSPRTLMPTLASDLSTTRRYTRARPRSFRKPSNDELRR